MSLLLSTMSFNVYLPIYAFICIMPYELLLIALHLTCAFDSYVFQCVQFHSIHSNNYWDGIPSKRVILLSAFRLRANWNWKCFNSNQFHFNIMYLHILDCSTWNWKNRNNSQYGGTVPFPSRYSSKIVEYITPFKSHQIVTLSGFCLKI